jgi:hypothetical protein
MEKPPFIKSTSASSPVGAASEKDRYPNRKQESGPRAQPDGGNENFPNRPQKSGGTDANSSSSPSGGTLPYPGPPTAPKKPFKLNGG